ncbi:class I SAM-dependent methyltransferase [uncultured Pontibacter sp.]|uniref:class I SAM-dependent methyltransferase n=1 Tax=uncultured Pontibacter sp. TaxID=453356 RepID=UPI0026115885|nr:class I SAM-dependent methyltransferase [uncultured Pontibacter sp.]
MSNTNFNSIAPVYDGLSRLVFGNALRRAQVAHLSLIPAKAKVLLIGGGSGWLLEQLLRYSPLVKVTYLEASEKMLEMTRRRIGQRTPAALPNITFRLGTEDNLQHGETYDVILTPFLLDLFPDERLVYLMDRLCNALHPQGLWLFSDFWPTQVPAPAWQRLLLRSMYTFFGKVSQVSATRLPDFDRHFARLSLQELEATAFYDGLVQAKVYRKV